jgi:hypothetical protein
MKSLWLALSLAVTCALGWVSWERLREESKKLEAQDGLRRLAVASAKAFPNGRLPKPGNFWRELGREPLLDPWGKPFSLEYPEPGSYFWRSYGPDGSPGTADDLVQAVDFSVAQDPLPPPGAPTATDAL